jgi:adenylate cyclase
VANGPGRNIEIKARVADRERVEGRAAKLADRGPTRIAQEDTFFHCPRGRLKLRVFEDGSGELIQYDRPDSRAPSESSYTIHHTPDPGPLGRALADALGVRGVVRKVRTLYLAGATRIHLDRVEGLGDFAELEVVLEPDQDAESGTATAAELMRALGIAEHDLLETAYIDLLGIGSDS